MTTEARYEAVLKDGTRISYDTLRTVIASDGTPEMQNGNHVYFFERDGMGIVAAHVESEIASYGMAQR